MIITDSGLINNQNFGVSESIANGGIGILTNVTVSGEPYPYGLGLDSISSGKGLTLTNVTMNNTRIRIFIDGTSTVWLKNTIISNNFAYDNCNDSVVSLGHNLDSGNSCGLNATGDLTNTNPLLGPLQDNGGSTLTHALLAGSPAIGAGDNNGCPPTDQRGVSRPQGVFCDIGAFEVVVIYTQKLYLPFIQRNAP
jgi:hypothetical protein